MKLSFNQENSNDCIEMNLETMEFTRLLEIMNNNADIFERMLECGISLVISEV